MANGLGGIYMALLVRNGKDWRNDRDAVGRAELALARIKAAAKCQFAV